MSPLITRVRPGRQNRRPAGAAAHDRRQPGRVLVVAALAPLLSTYAVIAAVFVLVNVVASNATFSAGGTLFAAGPAMLAVYQVPLEIGDAPLGVLPLLPTIGVVLLVRRTAAGAAQRLGYDEPGQALVVVGVIAGAHAAVGGLLAAAVSGPTVAVTPLIGLLVPGVVTGVAALLGTAPQCGITTALRRRLGPVAASGLRAGLVGLAALFTAGCATFVVGTVFSFDTVRQLFAASAPAAGGAFGMLLLSSAYVPNAVVASTGMVLGPGFSLGELSVQPFGFVPGPVPAVPLLASVPESYAGWWPLLLLLPLACGILVGFAVREVAEGTAARLCAVLIAGAVVAIGMLLSATLAGGQLGSGPLSPAGVPAGLVSLAGFGWIVVPGSVVAWITGPHRSLSQLREGRLVADVSPESPGSAEGDDGDEEDDVLDGAGSARTTARFDEAVDTTAEDTGESEEQRPQ